MTEPQDHVGGDEPTELPPASLLGRLRSKRASMDAGTFTDLDVPRWDDPPLKVRYRVLDHPTIRSRMARALKAPKGKRALAEVEAYEDLLITACVGVFAIEDGKQKSLHPDGEDMEWTRFDPDLAETFGLDGKVTTAREVLRRVYFADGDVITAANEVMKFSGYENDQNAEAFMGE